MELPSSHIDLKILCLLPSKSSTSDHSILNKKLVVLKLFHTSCQKCWIYTFKQSLEVGGPTVHIWNISILKKFVDVVVTLVKFTKNMVIQSVNFYLIVDMFTLGLLRSNFFRIFTMKLICFIVFPYLMSYIFLLWLFFVFVLFTYGDS